MNKKLVIFDGIHVECYRKLFKISKILYIFFPSHKEHLVHCFHDFRRFILPQFDLGQCPSCMDSVSWPAQWTVLTQMRQNWINSSWPITSIHIVVWQEVAVVVIDKTGTIWTRFCILSTKKTDMTDFFNSL